MLRNNRTPSEPTDADQALQQAVALRRRRQLETLQEPRFPSTGTEMVAARLAAARAKRDERGHSLIDLRAEDVTPAR